MINDYRLLSILFIIVIASAQQLDKSTNTLHFSSPIYFPVPYNTNYDADSAVFKREIPLSNEYLDQNYKYYVMDSIPITIKKENTFYRVISTLKNVTPDTGTAVYSVYLYLNSELIGFNNGGKHYQFVNAEGFWKNFPPGEYVLETHLKIVGPNIKFNQHDEPSSLTTIVMHYNL